MKHDNTDKGNKTSLANQHTVDELSALVKKHKVCWEVITEQIPRKEDQPKAVWYNLILHGAHSREDHPVPGCEKCKHLYKDLRRIAQWIIPKAERESRYEISIYEPYIGYTPSRGNRPEVDLTIQILHREHYDAPVDECEVLCLNEMKAKLAELGAQEKRWKDGE